MSFNAHAVWFESGIDTIQDGYAAAVAGVTQELNRKKADYYDYTRHIERGGAPTEERDNDGHLLWSQDDLLQATIGIAEEALGTLRKAYAVTIYHHWERSALRWTGRKNEKHDDLVLLVQEAGYPVDPRLGAVRDLANLLKHANDRWGRRLFESWPDAFASGFTPPPVGADWSPNWYDRVDLLDVHIKEIMITVRRSGPKSALPIF